MHETTVMPSQNDNRRLLAVKERISDTFNRGHWQDVGLLTNELELINRHPRLLRSLDFGDDDYEGNVAEVLLSLFSKSADNLGKIEEYLDRKFGDDSEYISDHPSERRITFSPNVFKVPDVELRADLVAVMMPFKGFDSIYSSIKKACSDADLACLRADDIWEDSTFIQDIVNLIFQAHIVICDFTGHNANVFYETGIAHTLGKTVVPISQSMSDIPSDLQQHRALIYLNNTEGLETMQRELTQRLVTIISK